MFSIAKPPVEYNSPEGENADNIGLNNSPENAITVEDGDVLFGQINDNYDRDWYAITLPEDQSATLTVTVTAFMEALSAGSNHLSVPTSGIDGSRP